MNIALRHYERRGFTLAFHFFLATEMTAFGRADATLTMCLRQAYSTP